MRHATKWSSKMPSLRDPRVMVDSCCNCTSRFSPSRSSSTYFWSLLTPHSPIFRSPSVVRLVVPIVRHARHSSAAESLEQYPWRRSYVTLTDQGGDHHRANPRAAADRHAPRARAGAGLFLACRPRRRSSCSSWAGNRARSSRLPRRCRACSGWLRRAPSLSGRVGALSRGWHAAAALGVGVACFAAVAVVGRGIGPQGAGSGRAHSPGRLVRLGQAGSTSHCATNRIVCRTDGPGGGI